MIFQAQGVSLSIEDSYYTKAAEKAYELKTGARALEGIVSNSTWRAYQTIEDNPKIYEEVILSGETVENNNCYKLKKKQNGKVLEKKKYSKTTKR